jgi:hypothetical protein
MEFEEINNRDRNGDEHLDEWMMERYDLAKTRTLEIITEDAVQLPYRDFFQKTAAFLSQTIAIMDGDNSEKTLEELKQQNQDLYGDILPENYETSYGNPAYAVETLGEYGQAFSFLYAELRGAIVYAFEKKFPDMTVTLELFLEVYAAFAQE